MAADYRHAVRGRAARRVPGHERRAGPADRGRVRRRLPVTAVGDPDQNIYAWRGASLFNLLDFPEQFRRADGSPPTAAPAVHELPLGRADPRRRRRGDPPLPAAAAARSGQAAACRGRERRGRRGGRAVRRRVDGGALDRRAGSSTLHDDGAKWSEIAVLCRTSRLFFPLQQAFAEHEMPVEIVGLAGLLKLPEVVEVLPTRAPWPTRTPASRSRASCSGPRYRVGLQGPGARRGAGRSEEPRAAGRRGGRRGDAVPVRRGARAPRRGRAICPTRAARAWRSSGASWRRCGSRPAGPSASSWPRSSGAPGCSRSSTPHTIRSRPRRQAQPRGVPRRGARVLAAGGRADAARVPRLRRHGGAATSRSGRRSSRAARTR